MENRNFKMFCPGLLEGRHFVVIPLLRNGLILGWWQCSLGGISKSPGQNILKFRFSIWFFIPKKEFYSISGGKFFLNQLCFWTGVL